MIDLSPNHLKTVRQILAEHVPACEVRAFGSRVICSAKDYSDLDLAVVGVTALDRSTLARPKEAFEKSDLPIRVDVLGWQRFSTTGSGSIHRCEVKARNGEDALFLDVYDRGARAWTRLYKVTAYDRLENSQRDIPLYDDEGFRGLDDAKEALTQWYLNNAPTLLVTLAG